MKVQPIVNFAQAGLNSDLSPWDLPADFITDIRNIRIKDKKLIPFGGYVAQADLPASFLCGLMMSITEEGYWILAGQDSVYSFRQGSFVDLTISGGFTVDQDLWFGTVISGIPILNNIQHFPQYCPDVGTSTQMEILPWDLVSTWEDRGESCLVMRSHKQFLFALGVTYQNVFYNDAVRWSSPADTGGVPDSWDELDTTNVAGFIKLGGEGGRIIDGLSLRDAFVVYRESGITVFDYVGGNFVWQVRHLSTTVGCISPNCVAEVNGTHYFIGDGDIYSNDGNSIRSILHNRIRNRFSTSFNYEYFTNSYVINNKIQKEVWFCIPSPEAQHPDTAFIFNWKDDTWTIVDMVESTAAGYGASGEAGESWDDLTGQWNTMDQSWDQINSVPFNNTILSTTDNSSDSGSVVSLDNNSNGTDEPFDSFFERIGYALEGLTRVNTITRLYPHSQGDGVFDITIGSQDYPGSPVRWKPAVSFTASQDRKVDIRTTGELHSLRVSGQYQSSAWSFTGFDVEYSEAGSR